MDDKYQIFTNQLKLYEHHIFRLKLRIKATAVFKLSNSAAVHEKLSSLTTTVVDRGTHKIVPRRCSL
ncbi:hypothetical protein, partial [Acidisoma silvae]|uniref:hypothetical protein n=1 Tax=Acidisoma silvae TaxID=2802396 RepID=UPI001D09C45A